MLGKGGFATVFHATHCKTNQEYALKRINTNVAEHIKHILNEIGVVSQATQNDTDHIVHCYDAWCEFQSEEVYESFINDRKCMAPPEKIIHYSPQKLEISHLNMTTSTPSLQSFGSKKAKQIKGKKSSIYKLYFFLLFELCKGTFDEFMFTKLPFKTSICLLKQITDGLSIMHKQNMIHRDIKPSNLFISKDGKAKIGDFGLSLILKGSTRKESCESERSDSISSVSSKESSELSAFLSSDIVRTSRTFSESYDNNDSEFAEAGSPPFLAPEQGSCKIDQKADIYSLGIVMYLMIVDFATSFERSLLIGKLKQGEVDLGLKEKCPQICDLICKMISVNPCERPSAMEVFDILCHI